MLLTVRGRQVHRLYTPPPTSIAPSSRSYISYLHIPGVGKAADAHPQGRGRLLDGGPLLPMLGLVLLLL